MKVNIFEVGDYVTIQGTPPELVFQVIEIVFKPFFDGDELFYVVQEGLCVNCIRWCWVERASKERIHEYLLSRSKNDISSW